MGLEVKRDKCPTHSDQDVAGNCGFCNKQICRECISAYGYYCSESCQTQNKEAADNAQKSKAAASKASFEKGMKTFRLVKYVVILGVLILATMFVYKAFLDPAGKQAWTWSPMGDMDPIIVGEKDGILYLMDDENLQAIRLKNGKEVSSTPAPELSGLKQFRILGDRIVGTSPMRICLADLDGSNVVKTELQTVPEGDPVLNDGCSKAYYVSRSKSNSSKGSGYRLVLNIINLQTGAILSTNPIQGTPDRATVLGISAAGVILQTGQEKKATKSKDGNQWQIREYDWSIELVDPTESKRIRRVPLPKQPSETPVFTDGWIRFPIDKTMYVLDMTNKVQHKIPIQVSEFSSPEHVIDGGQLFVVYRSGMVCYGLSDGKVVWQLNAGGKTENMYFGSDRIILLGAKSSKKNVDVTKMPGFNQAPDVVKDFGIGKAMDRSTPLLAAIDRKTGKYLWEEEGIRGNLLADEDRIALIADVSETGTLGFLREGVELYVRQFDPDSGKKIVSETTENLAMDQARLFGKRAVGMQYTDEGKTTIIAVHLK